MDGAGRLQPPWRAGRTMGGVLRRISAYSRGSPRLPIGRFSLDYRLAASRRATPLLSVVPCLLFSAFGGTGGSADAPGSAGAPPTGGVGGSAGVTGSGGAAGSGGSSSIQDAGTDSGCLVSQIPTVYLLVDRSSSMFHCLTGNTADAV